MSDIKFVIESSFQISGQSTYIPGLRPKRVKNACLRCQARKGRCSGTQPCDVCKVKNVPCIYKDSSRGGKRVNNGSKRKIEKDDGNSSPHSDFSDEENSKVIISNEASNNASSPGKTSNEVSFPRAKRQKIHSRTISQPYFRWLGPTAIAPPKDGTFRLLSVNLKSDEPDNGEYVVIERLDKTSPISSPPIHVPTDVQPEIPLPLPHKSLYKLFNERMSNFLPYLPYEIFEQRLSNGVIGECLLYAIASLAERITPTKLASTVITKNSTNASKENKVSTSLAERYSDTAKRLIVPHLSCPSIEIVFALLLIAYCEFGDDRDSGLWSWSGMAIRMSIDLGLQKSSTNDSDSLFSRNVFWSVVCLDRLISCGTGRVTTIPDSIIEHDPEPKWIETPDGDKRSDPFPYLCKLLMILGRVSNFLNYHIEKSTKTESNANIVEKFTSFQQEISDFYTTLPSDLLFDVQNFQHYAKLKHSQVFLLLHIWNQALVLAVHQPALVYPKCNVDVTGFMLNDHIHTQLTGSGAISIADMITFAELIEPESFLANPFLSQPIYMAACASLTLSRSLKGPSLPAYTFQKTYGTCRQTLNRMEEIWGGISWHSRTLDSLAASEPDVDLSINSKVFVKTKDLGVFRRASVDDSTRRWLADEIKQNQVDDIYGMFISGTIDGNHEYDKSPTSSNGNEFLPNFNENGIDLSGYTPQSGSQLLDTNAIDFNDPNTFKNLVIRDMNLNEFFNDEK